MSMNNYGWVITIEGAKSFNNIHLNIDHYLIFDALRTAREFSRNVNLKVTLYASKKDKKQYKTILIRTAELYKGEYLN